MLSTVTPGVDDNHLTDENSVSIRVVTAVADAEGVPPEDLDPVLHDAVNVDALDAIYKGSRRPVTVEFEFAGYLVKVDPDGRVSVQELSADD